MAKRKFNIVVEIEVNGDNARVFSPNLHLTLHDISNQFADAIHGGELTKTDLRQPTAWTFSGKAGNGKFQGFLETIDG